MISPTLARAWAASSNGPNRFWLVAAARFSSTRASPARRRRRAGLGSLAGRRSGPLRPGVDREDLHRLLFRLDERVHADDQLSLRVDISLKGKRGVGDLAAEKAGLDGGDHAAGGFDAVEDRPGRRAASSRVRASTK